MEEIAIIPGCRAAPPPLSEPQLLQITYGFEQATRARKPPQSTPPQMAADLRKWVKLFPLGE